MDRPPTFDKEGGGAGPMTSIRATGSTRGALRVSAFTRCSRRRGAWDHAVGTRRARRT